MQSASEEIHRQQASENSSGGVGSVHFMLGALFSLNMVAVIGHFDNSKLVTAQSPKTAGLD